jgi:hypothetical protein
MSPWFLAILVTHAFSIHVLDIYGWMPRARFTGPIKNNWSVSKQRRFMLMKSGAQHWRVGLPDVLFSQKIQILWKFFRALHRMEKGWNIIWPFGIYYGHFTFYGHLVILWTFGIFSPVLVNCVEKNLATLLTARQRPDETGLTLLFQLSFNSPLSCGWSWALHM